MTSYSKETKKYLLEITEKNKCCARMFGDIMSLPEKNSEKRAEIILNSQKYFKCDLCFQAYLRALFIIYGNVTDPAKRYHLELSFETSDERDSAKYVMEQKGFEMTSGERGGRFLLYTKSTSGIEAFFARIGANKAVFDLMNSIIVKDLNNQANRQLNCDMANIRKTLSSAKPYIDAVNKLKESGGIIRLPADLKETAKLRVEFPQASMSDLALMHEPPISKSGVKHRLDKIVEISQKFEEK